MSILLGSGINLNTITTTGRNAGVSTATGTLIYNSTLQELQVYKGSEYGWVAANDEFIEATGGTVSEYVSGNRLVRAHVFYSTGVFTVTKGVGQNAKIDFLLVGGGGGGGSQRGGGGGAGGFVLNTQYGINPGRYTVTVGSGGQGARYTTENGLGGSSSSFLIAAAVGGGGGGSGNNPPADVNAVGDPGGSGGGAASVSGTNILGGTGTSGQGNPGGSVTGSPGGGELGGAGGGGAGAAGGNSIIPNGDTGQPGGAGSLSALSGTSTHYAGGGGGGAGNTVAAVGGTGGIGGGGTGGTDSVDDATQGAENTGGGGGGGGDNERGFNGGSGIVIIRYNISNTVGTAKATGGTIRFGDGKTIHEFRSSGTFTRTDPTLTSADVLQVAGGGSGGVLFGGGGGAGGLVFRTGAPISTPTYTITVGAGGVSRLPGGSPDGGISLSDPLFKGTNGSPTVGIVTTCIGGGAGGANPTPERNGNPGGSGGGFSQRPTALPLGTGTSGQGNPGGPLFAADDAGTGGGGAGAVGGSNGTPIIGGNGGNGLLYSISGTSTYYAGGGGGGTRNTGTGGSGGLGGGGDAGQLVPNLVAENGESGTGGGGGGGAYRVPSPAFSAFVYPSGNGGSGIVIISYPT
jgi:hypothetical protein